MHVVSNREKDIFDQIQKEKMLTMLVSGQVHYLINSMKYLRDCFTTYRLIFLDLGRKH